MTADMSAVVTAVGLAVGGARTAADLLLWPPLDVEPVDPAQHLGRRGLRYLDRATQLAMVAAQDALRAAALVRGEPRPVPGEPGLLPRAELAVRADAIGVVVSSNYGNLDSVCDTVDVVAGTGGTRLVSPMLAPRLSSNVVASELAIRFGLRGVNLMLCNGATSGLDAVRWAGCLIEAGRVAHVLVVGVEPDTPVVRALSGQVRPLDGAVALVLEARGVARERAVAELAGIDTFARAPGPGDAVARLPPGPVAAWFADAGVPVPADAPRVDLAARWGSASGALGVLQCAAAVAHLTAGGDGPVGVVAAQPGEAAAVLVRRPVDTVRRLSGATCTTEHCEGRR